MVESIMTLEKVAEKYPQLFQLRLRKVEGQLQYQSTEQQPAYTLTTPRHVAIPLLPKVETVL